MSRSLSQLTLTSEDIQGLLALFPKGVVALDLETTGLSPLVDKVIEIAAVKINPKGEITTFHTLINPLIEIPEFTIQFHGLTNNDLTHAPTIKKPLKELWHFTERLPVIAHNSSFDLGFLIKASHDYQIEFPPLDVYDSCRWGRAIFKNLDTKPSNYKLNTLCDFFQVSLNHHVAMEDTYACLKVMAGYQKLSVDQSDIIKRSFVFRLSQFDRNDCFNFSTRLNKLAEFVKEKKLLSLEYKGNTIKSSIRPIRPIGLMPLPKGPVLFAECLLSGMNKSFLLKKIRSYDLLEACYLNKEPI